MFSVRFQESPGNILSNLDCFLDRPTLRDETWKSFRCGNVVAVFDLLDVEPNGELIRHSSTDHTPECRSQSGANEGMQHENLS